MGRSEAFCASVLVAGGACFAAGAGMALGLVPDPTEGRLAQPLWGVLAVLGLLFAVVGTWLRMVRPKDPQAGELMVGYVLYHTPRPALLLASLASLLFAGGWVAAGLGLRGPWAEALSPSGSDWTLLLFLSAAALFLGVLGVLALAWSRGRGSSARKGSAARSLAFACVLALLPWALRAAFIG